MYIAFSNSCRETVCQKCPLIPHISLLPTFLFHTSSEASLVTGTTAPASVLRLFERSAASHSFPASQVHPKYFWMHNRAFQKVQSSQRLKLLWLINWYPFSSNLIPWKAISAGSKIITADVPDFESLEKSVDSLTLRAESFSSSLNLKLACTALFEEWECGGFGKWRVQHILSIIDFGKPYKPVLVPPRILHGWSMVLLLPCKHVRKETFWYFDTIRKRICTSSHHMYGAMEFASCGKHAFSPAMLHICVTQCIRSVTKVSSQYAYGMFRVFFITAILTTLYTFETSST